MERIVKVYSNNSKKARLKRNKNKFQHIWDAEKQIYVKVRKAKYPVRTNKTKKDWRDIDKSKALKTRQEAPKKSKKTVSPTAIARPITNRTTSKQTTARTTTIKPNGIVHIWDSKTLRYKRAA